MGRGHASNNPLPPRGSGSGSGGFVRFQFAALRLVSLTESRLKIRLKINHPVKHAPRGAKRGKRPFLIV